MKIIKIMSLGLIILLMIIGLMGCSQQEGVVKLDLETSTEGEGTIVLTPDQNSYEKNTEVKLTAEPASGYGFVKWKGDISETQKSVKIVMDSDITIIAEFRQKKVSTPSIESTEGTYYSETETNIIEMSCETSDATIYYTTDGMEPDKSSNEYTGSFEISSDVTIKAKAYKTDWKTSKKVSKEYNLINKKWEFVSGGKIKSSPAVVNDGTIYVGSFDNNLYAIDNDGSEKWKFGTRYTPPGTPTIDNDGTIYSGGPWTDIYAINPDGTQKWRCSRDYAGGGGYNLTIGTNENIYSFTGDGNYPLIALYSNDGTEKWSYDPNSSFNSSPAINGELLFVGNHNGDFHAIKDNGSSKTLKDTFYTGNLIEKTPAIGGNETLYVGNDNGKLFALSYDKTEEKLTENWSYSASGNLENSIETSPVIASDGIIYFGCNDGNLYAINPDGTKKWVFNTNDKILSSPAIGSDGTIFFGSNDGNFYAVNPDGTKKWSYNTGSPIKSSPAIADGGTIYFGCDNGKLYALESEVDGLANSPWPMFHHDLHHTGRIGY